MIVDRNSAIHWRSIWRWDPLPVELQEELDSLERRYPISADFCEDALWFHLVAVPHLDHQHVLMLDKARGGRP